MIFYHSVCHAASVSIYVFAPRPPQLGIMLYATCCMPHALWPTLDCGIFIQNV